MGRVLSFIAVLLFLSFSSCSNKESDISLAFTSADYDKVVLIADDILSSELDSDALYFKSASHYRLGNLKEAEEIRVMTTILMHLKSYYVPQKILRELFMQEISYIQMVDSTGSTIFCTIRR